MRRHRSLLPSIADYREVPRTWRGDLLAGLTVGIVALPLALAFGVSSGAGAASGLVTAIIAGVIGGAISGIMRWELMEPGIQVLPGVADRRGHRQLR